MKALKTYAATAAALAVYHLCVGLMFATTVRDLKRVNGEQMEPAVFAQFVYAWPRALGVIEFMDVEVKKTMVKTNETLEACVVFVEKANTAKRGK